MLIQFTVSNYRSINHAVSLDMRSSNLKDAHSDNIFRRSNKKQASNDKESYLKSAVIYGANASGKSNIIQALAFMRDFTIYSAPKGQVGDAIKTEPFLLDVTSASAASFFEIIFIAEGRQYRYGFEATRQHIEAEWLYHVPNKIETMLFERHYVAEDSIPAIQLSGVFKEGKPFIANVRNNSLFLSLVAQLNGEISSHIIRWFREKLNVINAIELDSLKGYTANQTTDNETKEPIIEFIKGLDVGIQAIETTKENVNISDMPEELRASLAPLLEEGGWQKFNIQTSHKRYEKGEYVGDIMLSLERNESTGTQKLFALAGPIMTTLNKGEILVVDELDARLHPMITRAIVKLFHSKERNPHNAQLVFATHDVNLLSAELFRRDQIWFCEKDSYEASDIYSLAEYQGVRNNSNYGKDYLAGRYGAIPFINVDSFVIGADDGAKV